MSYKIDGVINTNRAQSTLSGPNIRILPNSLVPSGTNYDSSGNTYGKVELLLNKSWESDSAHKEGVYVRDENGYLSLTGAAGGTARNVFTSENGTLAFNELGTSSFLSIRGKENEGESRYFLTTDSPLIPHESLYINNNSDPMFATIPNNVLSTSLSNSNGQSVLMFKAAKTGLYTVDVTVDYDNNDYGTNPSVWSNSPTPVVSGSRQLRIGIVPGSATTVDSLDDIGCTVIHEFNDQPIPDAALKQTQNVSLMVKVNNAGDFIAYDVAALDIDSDNVAFNVVLFQVSQPAAEAVAGNGGGSSYDQSLNTTDAVTFSSLSTEEIKTDTLTESTGGSGVTIDGVLLKDGAVQTDSIGELTDGSGVTIDGVLLKDGVVHTDTVGEKTVDTGVTIDGVLLKDGAVQTDTVDEKTADAGVTIDGVLLKDGVIQTDTVGEKTADAGVTIDGVLLKDGAVQTDTVGEKTADAGVTIDGVLLKDGVIQTDTVGEKTADAGVTIDGVLLKDGAVQTDTVGEKTADTGVTIDGVLLKDGRIILGESVPYHINETASKYYVDDLKTDISNDISNVETDIGSLSSNLSSKFSYTQVESDIVHWQSNRYRNNELFGSSVSLSRDGIIIAAMSKFDIGVFELDKLYGWKHVSTIPIDDMGIEQPQPGQMSMSNDGSTIVYGIPQDGVSKVYRKSDSFNQLGSDIGGRPVSVTSGYGKFGFSVSISGNGDRIAVGDPLPNHDGNTTGYARMYQYDHLSMSWQQMGSDIDGLLQHYNYSSFGSSISMSDDGSKVAIGAGGLDGYAGVYQWDGSSWIQMGNDILRPTGISYFGQSVSISDNGYTVAIGVRVYNWRDDDWHEMGSGIEGEDLHDESGSSVSISGNGLTVAIGAKYNDGTTGQNSGAGHARVYFWSGFEWIQFGSDIDGEDIDDSSGYSVSLSSDGNSVAIGAPAGGYYNTGNVRIYHHDKLALSSDIIEVRGNVITDIIGERSNDTGVTIDGVLLKDGAVQTDMVNEQTVDTGVTIDGVLLKDGVVQTDSIGESTDGSGVTFGSQVKVDEIVERTDGYGVMIEGTKMVTETSPWRQLGTDIDGEADDDFSGFSVSLSDDGSVVAIGAIGNDESESNSGHVRVYEWKNDGWDQKGMDINGEASSDQSGFSVSLSSDGSVVAIGAAYNDGSGNLKFNSGHVRVYEWNDTTWDQKGTDIDGEATGDTSGHSLSLSSDGSVVAIGAVRNDGSGNLKSNSGHVRVYEWKNNGWDQKGTDIDGEAYDDWSGYSMSLSSDGSVVAIGASYNDGSGNLKSNSGHVRIYEWNDTKWDQKGMDIDGEASGDLSGLSVSLSSDGSVVAIGAIENDGSGNLKPGSGHVRVYEWNDTEWDQKGMDIDGEAEYGYSGISVSLSGDGSVVAIGAEIYNGYMGYTQVWKLEGTTWRQIENTLYGAQTSERFGRSVSLSKDGSVVAIGAPGVESGRVRIFGSNVSGLNAYRVHATEVHTDSINEKTADTGVTIDGVLLKDGAVQTDTVSELTDGSGVTIDGVLLKDGVVRTDMVSELTDGSGVTVDGVLIKDGGIRIMTREGTIISSEYSSWTQKGNELLGEDSGDVFGLYNGISMSTDGRVLAIGSKWADGINNYSTNVGEVIVYNWDTNLSSWIQRGEKLYGDALLDYFGISVSLSSDGSIVAIGATLEGAVGQGRVRVYEWNDSSSSWTLKGGDIDGEANYDYSGVSVSLSSDGLIVAIGASGNDDNGNLSGHVRVYEFDDSSSSWAQKGGDIDGEAPDDRSGRLVSLSGDGSIVAIGTNQNDGKNGTDSGHVRVYEWDDSSLSWTQKGADVDGKTTYSDMSSLSSSSDGLVLAIGFKGDDTSNVDSGRVQVLEWKNDSWVQRGEDFQGISQGDNLGVSVSLSNDGTRIAMGARYSDTIPHTNSGHVNILDWDGLEWSQVGGTIVGGDSEQAGWVSLSGDGTTLAVGGYNSAYSKGRVKVFDEPFRDVSVVDSNALVVDYSKQIIDSVTNGYIEKYILSGGNCLEGQPLSYDYSLTGQVAVKPFDTTPTQLMYAGIAMSDAVVGSTVKVTKNLAYTKVRVKNFKSPWHDVTLQPSGSFHYGSNGQSFVRLTDTGGLYGNYSNGENYEYMIFNSSASRLSFRLSYLDTEQSYDRLTITLYNSDGTWASGPYTYTGPNRTNMADMILDPTMKVKLQFVSDGSTTRSGWKIYLKKLDSLNNNFEDDLPDAAVVKNQTPLIIYFLPPYDSVTTLNLSPFDPVIVGVAMESYDPIVDGQLVMAKNINVEYDIPKINGVSTIDLEGSQYTKLTLDAERVYLNATYQMSDARIKKDIVEIDDGESFDIIERLNPVKYRYISQNDRDALTYGFLAQEVKEVLPAAVSVDSSYNGFENFHFFRKDVVWTVSVSAIQELIRKHALVRADHDGLKAEHDTLKAEHDTLKTEHDTLKTEHDTLKTEHDTLKTEHDTLKTEHDTLKTEHDSLKAEHDSIVSRVEALEQHHV